MKTPIKYWGGKQQLAHKILPLIPDHRVYIEPFFGGGAVFFAKPKSKIEIINDLNDNVINFYRIVKQPKTFERLCKEIDLALYSEYQHRHAKIIWEQGKDYDNVIRAWAFFVLSRQGFRGQIGPGWGFDDNRDLAKGFDNAKRNFDEKYLARLRYTQIFCRDALRVIKNTDSLDSFFFLDPPYYNSDCTHYKGYTLEHYTALLELLSKVKGKFLLTSYPSEVLNEYTESHGWHALNNEMYLSASLKEGAKKTEIFTTNYEASDRS